MIVRTLTALAGTALLAACSGSEEPPAPPVENEAVETLPVEPLPEAPVVAPPTIENIVSPANETAETPDPDQQVLDDAAATGMTSASRRDEPTDPTVEETQPAR